MWMEATAAAAGAAGFLAWAARGRSAQVFAPSAWRGMPGRNRIALTFDDGPSESTPELLEILAANRAKATFFVCGRNAARLPGVVRAIAAAGHEIGNHTWSHPRMDFMPTVKIREELCRTQETIATLTGKPPRLFRAPYGVRWFGLGDVQRELELTGVMWTVIGRDWTLPAPSVSRRLLRAAKDGAIFCLHDGRVLLENPNISATLDAVREILPQLHAKHLSVTSVSAILEK